jgi:hypothetical protein
MKSIAAVIASQPDAVLAAVTARLGELREAEGKAESYARKLDAARAAADLRRLELGRALVAARALWPATNEAQAGARGPSGVSWKAYLEREGISESTAWRYMELASAADRPDAPARAAGDPLPTYRELGIDPDAADRLKRDPRAALRAMGLADTEIDALAKRVKSTANVNGGSGDVERGSYCTPKKYADAVGPWDLDPFSNPRSHIVSTLSCQLERGDNGLFVPQTPGSYWVAPSGDVVAACEAMQRGEIEMSIARSTTRVWFQPPYDIVEQALAHYGHTRFCALLRLDTSTEWFRALWQLTDVIAIPLERLEFEAPPGVETSANPYPHALYYAREADVTDEIRKLCIVLRAEH